MGLLSFKQKQPEVELVSDLDAMIAKPIGFRLHNQIHEIKPITVQEFFAFSNEWSEVVAWGKKDSIEPRQYIKKMTALFNSVCETIHENDVSKMTQAQLGALFELVIQTVTGKAHTLPNVSEAEKKN